MSQDRNPFSKRTSHIELPKGNEIMHISSAEEKRALLPGREQIHFPDFESIKRVYKAFGLGTEIFEISDMTAETILDQGSKQLDELVKMILKKDLRPEEIKLLDDLYTYLAEEDHPQPSDYIYVFGAITPLRAEKAVELYKKGLAPRIILSGRGPFYGDISKPTEAERYAEIILKAGIPDKALIIEKDSITIPDNVRRTLNIMDLKQMPYNSFIIVNSPYAQRRGWCVWKKRTSESITIYRVNSDTNEKFAAGTWYKNEEGLRVVLGEFIKLRNTIAFNDA